MTHRTNILEVITPSSKSCSKCGAVKPLSSYNKSKKSPDGHRTECKWCRAKEGGKYRDSYYRKNYGISLEDYNTMFEEQSGCCKICDTHQVEFKKSLHVDHDHVTGAVRGLLCHRCNTALGSLDDDIDKMKRCIEYLENDDVA